MGFDDSDFNSGKKPSFDKPDGLSYDSYEIDNGMTGLLLKKREPKAAPQKDGTKLELPKDGLNKVDLETFAEVFKETKEASRKANVNTWRVSDVNIDEFREYHPDADCYLTPDKSTVAITKDGDIVAVCKNPNDTYTGKDIIDMAIKAGGKKLDSYDGNHKFYMKCGFEPVSWCEWDEQYKPYDWNEDKNKREDIIFYRYTGKTENYISRDDFKASTDVCIDYDAAMTMRNNSIRKDN